MKREFFSIKSEIEQALLINFPIVALESAVITHGLPRPTNLKLAREMEKIVRGQGAIPATIAVLDGAIHVGLSQAELERLAFEEAVRKISCRDFGIALSKKISGGTTVAGTIVAASQVGIRVFATGGIGGVHIDSHFDVSADLNVLAKEKMIVICSGAKAILDLPATLEVLESLGVPVIGFQTDEFPAFYSSRSGLKVDMRADSCAEIVSIARAHWACGVAGSIVVTVPPPKATEVDHDKVESALQNALKEAQDKQIHGAAVTPYLLEKISQLTGGSSLNSNLNLLKNNAKVAAQIAIALSATTLHQG